MNKRTSAVHVSTIRKQHKDQVYECHLLRRSYRENGKVKTETLGNLSHLPAETIELVRRSLKGEIFVPVGAAPFDPDTLRITRSLPHGHVAAAHAMATRLGLAALIGPPCRERDLVLGLVLARVVEPGSKLAATRLWADTTIGVDWGLADASTDEVYAALDWLLTRKASIEAGLAARHLVPGGRVLFDLTSSWMEGRCCPLACRGHSRDGKRGKPQIEYGILADPEGRPVAVEIFPGNTSDPASFTTAIDTVRRRFHLPTITFVGDRGMITQARIETLRDLPGASWITALRFAQIKALMEAGAIQLSLFDQTHLVEITHPDYPGERLVVCRNPVLAEERARKRVALLEATERDLAKLQATVDAGRLKDATKIALRAGRIVNKYQVGKHFELVVEHGVLRLSRREARIAAEAATDGLYVVRTPLSPEQMPSAEVVGIYKSLSEVEADFRSWKAMDLALRPIYHWTENRVRAHIVLCLLAGYLTWHLRRALAPITFADTARPGPTRPDPVAPATPSASAQAKAAIKATPDREPVFSYPSLLKHLATLTRNACRIADTPVSFDRLADPTPTQRRVFQLIDAPLPLRLM